MAHRSQELIEFQNANCATCDKADKTAVGTGLPCCQFPGQIEAKDGICLTHRQREAEHGIQYVRQVANV